MQAASCASRATSAGNRHLLQPRLANVERKPRSKCGAVRTGGRRSWIDAAAHCRTAVAPILRVHGHLSCSCGPGQWPDRDVDGQEKGAEGLRPSAPGRKRSHPWADWQARSSLEPSAHQQSHPAHVVAGAGIVWRTSAPKEPFCTGGHRHRLPLTTKGLRWLVHAGKPPGDPSQRAEETQINRTRVVRLAEKLPSGPAAGDGWAGRAQIKKALR